MTNVICKEVTSIPAGDNPFWHDSYNMGVGIGGSWILMHDQHPGSETEPDYFYLVHQKTGQRFKLIISY